MNRQCDWFTNLHLITLPGQVRTCKAYKVWITSVTELTGFTNMHSITLPGQVHTNLQSMNRKCDWIYKYEFHHTIWPSQFLQSLQLWIVSVTEFISACDQRKSFIYNHLQMTDQMVANKLKTYSLLLFQNQKRTFSCCELSLLGKTLASFLDGTSFWYSSRGKYFRQWVTTTKGSRLHVFDPS